MIAFGLLNICRHQFPYLCLGIHSSLNKPAVQTRQPACLRDLLLYTQFEKDEVLLLNFLKVFQVAIRCVALHIRNVYKKNMAFTKTCCKRKA